jgi:hypothetical protein
MATIDAQSLERAVAIARWLGRLCRDARQFPNASLAYESFVKRPTAAISEAALMGQQQER